MVSTNPGFQSVWRTIPQWFPSFYFERPDFAQGEWEIPEYTVTKARYMVLNRDQYRSKLAALFHLMELKTGSRILSVGAGTGIDLCEWGRKSIEPVAVEVHPDKVASLNALARFYGLSLDGRVAFAEKLPFHAYSFDAVFTENAFEHFAYPVLAIAEQYRVLKPGGRIVIIDGNILSVMGLYDQLVKEPPRTQGKSGGLKWFKLKNYPREVYGNGYICRDEDWHTPKWWYQRLIDTGFTNIRSGTTSSIFHPARPAWLHPFFGKCLVVGVKPQEG